MTPSERAAYNAEMTAKQRKRYQAMSPSERARKVEKNRERRAMSPSTRAKKAEQDRERRRATLPLVEAARRAQRKESQRGRYQAMSPSQKTRFNEKNKERYHNMPPSQKEEYLACARVRSRKRGMLKKLRNSVTYQEADSETREEMENAAIEELDEECKAKGLIALASKCRTVNRHVMPEPEGQNDTVYDTLISGFGQRVLQEIRLREKDRKEAISQKSSRGKPRKLKSIPHDWMT